MHMARILHFLSSYPHIKTMVMLIITISVLFVGHAGMAQTTAPGLEAIKKGCTSGNPEALVQCKKLCNQGMQFYCDALNIKPSAEVDPAIDPVPVEGTCNIPDDKFPTLEGYTPEQYMSLKLAQQGYKVQTRAQAIEKQCNVLGNIKYCKILCKAGCNQYCNYCSMVEGYKTNKRWGGGMTYAFLEQSLDPNAQVTDKETRIIHNCNPKTKKRGVGIIPGGDENFIGIGYLPDPSYCKGYCHELLAINDTPLRRAFQAGALGNKNEYDGVPTVLEWEWAAGHIRQCDPFFIKWLHAFKRGASSDNPLRPGDPLFDRFSPLVTLQPGVHSYRLPPYDDGQPRYLCGASVWIDSSGQQQEANYAEECRSGNSRACKISCDQGNQESCTLKQEWSDKYSCEQYGGSPNQPACQDLCATGKSEYKKYCKQ